MLDATLARVPTRCALGRYQGVLSTVHVEVAGRPLTFLFDLGAGVTALDAAVADDLRLGEVRRVTGRRMTGADVDLALLEPTPLTVGDYQLPARSLGKLDLARLLPDDWPRVDGVLALDALEHVPFAVDFARDRMDLGAPLDRDGLSSLRIRLHRQIPHTSLVVLVAVGEGEDACWFELDNSNTGPVLVAPHAAARLGLAAGTEPTETNITVPGAGTIRVPVLARDILYDGNLGRTFTASRRFGFDLAQGWIGVAPRS